jgi:hypothetical protein
MLLQPDKAARYDPASRVCPLVHLLTILALVRARPGSEE